ncbi:MAG: branched chain amino acid aminotransferase [unclassified Hahellaceae]|nr:branched chain amino acid aminotransferase [Hahellaceae bacterium]|tara:strand:+ start:8739 stop:9665 length:927 start_codon:yes stop_codon:yes gene_type:complete
MTSMADRDGFIWMDGEMVPWREAKVHVLTHTLHYGAGVFEGVRAYKTDQGTALFRLEDHTNRLFDSAHILNMKMPFSRTEISQAQLTAVKANNLDSAYIRPMVFYGAEGMGLRASNLQVHVMVAAWEWGSYLGEDSVANGLKVRTSSITRHHPNIAMTRAKANGQYINSMMALNEALASGCDEALMLDPAGYVAEGSAVNFFMVKNRVLYTPQLTSCLNGITRNTIFRLAEELGLRVVEKPITRDEVYIADEAFFTGTAAEVTPIRMLDERQIGEGTRGPVTEKLQSLYYDVVKGRREDYSEWLSYLD